MFTRFRTKSSGRLSERESDAGSRVRPHRRQFVIGPRPVLPSASWVLRPLGASRWISHCPDLHTRWVRDADGALWGLLGLALEWAARHPEPGMDWRCRFFIEQRQAGWLSAKEQLYDMGDVLRFPLFNCARNHALLIGLEPALRGGKVVQRELLRRIAPELLRHPANPPNSDFGALPAFRARLAMISCQITSRA